MMETRAQLRLATTAIIAALAISSTPLLAQDAPPLDSSLDEPATPTADPLAPEPGADTSIVPVTDAPEVAPTASEAAPAAATKAKPARRAATTTKSPAARPAPAPAGRVDSLAPEVTAAEPIQLTPAAEAPSAPEPPVAVEPAASRQMQSNAFLMIAAAGALLLAALAAIAIAIRRRRRRATEVEEADWQAEEVAVADAEPAMVVEPEPVRTEPTFVTAAAPVAAPAMVVEPEPAPERTEPAFFAPAAAAAAPATAEPATRTVEGPVTELPEGFDLSRFGHNVQQAYLGPTEDNPSLSLKHRLRKAAAMDQMERNMDAEVEAATGESVLDEADATPPAEAPAAKPAVADKAPGDFMLAKPGIKQTKPAVYTS